MDTDSYEEFCEKADTATKKGKLLKFHRYKRSLRHDSEGIFNDDVKIAILDLRSTTIKRIGYWSSSNSTYYHYAKGLLEIWYNFTEMPPQEFNISSLSYFDHT